MSTHLTYHLFVSTFDYTEKSEAAKNGGCFEENSIVYDNVRGPTRIQDVSVGDKILSVGADGRYEYSEVAFFLDYDPTSERLYYEFATESGSKISMTPSHLIFVGGSEKRRDQMKADFAKFVIVGNYVLVRTSPDQAGTLEKVVSISTRLGKGAYAPATLNGNIVVNNIAASCYAIFRDEKLTHSFFLPMRWMFQFINFGDRLSSSLHVGQSSSDINLEQQQQQQQQENSLEDLTNLGRHRRSAAHTHQLGIHWYARLLYRAFGHFIPARLIYN